MLRLRERRLRLRWEVRVPGTKVWLPAPADVEAEQKLRVDLQGPANQGGMIGARRNGEGAAHERRDRACKPFDGEHGILSVREDVPRVQSAPAQRRRLSHFSPRREDRPEKNRARPRRPGARRRCILSISDKRNRKRL